MGELLSNHRQRMDRLCGRCNKPFGEHYFPRDVDGDCDQEAFDSRFVCPRADTGSGRGRGPESLTFLVERPESVGVIPLLPADSAARKEIPIFSGVLQYFPLAIAAVARLSKRGNDKHNPGEVMRWSREKSSDHEDCIARHLIDVNALDHVTGEYEDAMALAWRALAKLQLLEEQRLGRVPVAVTTGLHTVTVTPAASSPELTER